MSMDVEVQAVLEHFQNLPNSSRRALYQGILSQLRRDEWREVKERAAETSFSCDILGKLPVEIASLVAFHMNLADLVVLQRVSRRWKEVLSSSFVQGSAVRSFMGPESSAQINDHTSPFQLIKKRVRMERGQPTSKFKLRSPFALEHDILIQSGGVGYCNSIYAWLDGTTGRTSISLLNLRTGKSDQVTTENREQLSEINISDKIIAAISIRGYCHVWDLKTLEHKAFRLQSLYYKHFLISGIKVLIAYDKSVVHWGFDSATARTFNVGPSVALLALDPAKDQFTIASLTDSSRSSSEAQLWIHDCNTQLQLRIETYGLDNYRNLGLLKTRYQSLPFEVAFQWTWCPGEEPQHIDRDQSSAVFRRIITSSESDDTPLASLHQGGYMTYFSIDTTGDHVDVHVAPTKRMSDAAFLDQNLIYVCGKMDANVHKLGTRICIAIPKGNLQYYPVQRDLPHMTCEWVYGDQNFVIFVNMEDVEVWSFDETWQPAKIPQAY